MLKDDLKFLDKVMKMRTKRDLRDNYFCWIYPFTNENISGYYEQLNFKDKDILTVTSSGDHALNALLKESKTVDSFDTNPLAKYYSELKVAAIKSLDYEEFLLFFLKEIGLIKKSKHYFDINLYKKIRTNLNGDYLSFWDYFFDKYNNKELKKSFLFSDDKLFYKNIIKVNDYLEESNYYKLRNILKTKSINYYDLSVSELPRLNKEYDYVMFSNIVAYLDDIYDKDFLKEFKKIIDKLNKNNKTRFLICYLYYNNIYNRDESYNDIYNPNFVNKYFDSNDYEYIEFISTDMYEYPVYLSYKKMDKVLISKQKNNQN